MHKPIALAQPSLPFRLSPYLRVVWLFIFLIPLVLWNITSEVVSYFRYGAPSGQMWYVFSKLFALYAVLLLWYQVLSSLLKETPHRILLPDWGFLRHRIVGSITLLMLLLHIACFIAAASLRKGAVAWGLLLPDFQDFYHTSITIGWCGFVLAIIALSAAIMRKHFLKWKMLHRAMIGVTVLALIHGYLIGTETRYGIYESFYIGLFASLMLAVGLRWRLISRSQSD